MTKRSGTNLPESRRAELGYGRISLRLPVELLKRLGELAAEHRLSRAAVVAWLIASQLLACGGADPVAHPSSPACDANTITVRLVTADLTPTGLDAYSSCAVPDDPSLYGKVWCCPELPQPDPASP